MIKEKAKKMTKTMANHQLVEAWLAMNERSQAYLAKHIKVNPAIVSRFMNGMDVSAKVLLKMAEVTRLQLRIEFCKGCGKVINFTHPCPCSRKGVIR